MIREYSKMYLKNKQLQNFNSADNSIHLYKILYASSDMQSVYD